MTCVCVIDSQQHMMEQKLYIKMQQKYKKWIELN